MKRDEIYNDKIINAKEKIKAVLLKYDYDWMIGFSGGKDSTVLVQLIFEVLLELDPIFFKNKKIHVVSLDTLIENPMVLKQLNVSLELIQNFANKNSLPITTYKVKPDITESFWVNLIGRGYPLPNQSFRWCTDRLKIKPMNEYIKTVSTEKQKIITVLGVRKGESISRDIKLKRNSIENIEL